MYHGKKGCQLQGLGKHTTKQEAAAEEYPSLILGSSFCGVSLGDF